MLQLHYQIQLKDARKVLRALILCELLFCVIYFYDFLLSHPILRISKLFDLDSEASIPTWFSVIQLYMIGLISLLVAFNKRTVPPPSKSGLILFGLGFLYLSLDEEASIHEKMTYEFYNNPLVPYFHGQHGIWIVVYGVVAIILSLILIKDIIAICKSFPKESLIFALGMIIYLAGSAGAETITFFYIDKTNPFIYCWEVILEELLEMGGASVLLYSVLTLAIKKSLD